MGIALPFGPEMMGSGKYLFSGHQVRATIDRSSGNFAQGTPTMNSQQIVDNIASEACLSLFHDYSLTLQRADISGDDGARELVYCAVIGYSSEQMRGTLLLATSSEPLGRTAPVAGSSLREWIAELSNQLLGRVKTRLAERGVLLAISTPVVLRGSHLRPLTTQEVAPLTFVCDGGCVCVWMDAVLSPELDLSQVQTDCQVMGEGEAMLF